MSAFSATPLPLRSLSPCDVAASRKVLVSARPMRLPTPTECIIRRYDGRITADRAAVDHDADELRRRLLQPEAALRAARALARVPVDGGGGGGEAAARRGLRAGRVLRQRRVRQRRVRVSGRTCSSDACASAVVPGGRPSAARARRRHHRRREHRRRRARLQQRLLGRPAELLARAACRSPRAVDGARDRMKRSRPDFHTVTCRSIMPNGMHAADARGACLDVCFRVPVLESTITTTRSAIR